ncbi:hypothetical protein FGIG_11173 [Fasciola gigantica]|uniref:Uncharacterized protein n=1 Tax=Fasciola gigantica TaxID=46835 RepID=A0A504Z4B7_FASGI|nr:hypothetical protein FGIG_11173 [Fasciola gigantica]
MCTREWRQHFGHDPELIRISDGRVSNANQMNKQVQTQYNVTSSFVFVDEKSESPLRMKPVVTSTKMAHGGYYEGDLSVEHTSGGLLFLENDAVSVRRNFLVDLLYYKPNCSEISQSQ